MFRNIGEIVDLISVIIRAISNLLNAGERQTQLILEASEFDVEQKRDELADKLIEFQKRKAERAAKLAAVSAMAKAA